MAAAGDTYEMAAAGAQKRDTSTSTGKRSYEWIRPVTDYKDAFEGLPNIVEGKVVFVKAKEYSYKVFGDNIDNIPLLKRRSLSVNKTYTPSFAWNYGFEVDVDKNPAVLDIDNVEWVNRVKNIYVKLFRDTCSAIDADQTVDDKEGKKMQAKLRYDLMMTNFYDLRYPVPEQDAGFGDQDYNGDVYDEVEAILKEHNIAPDSYKDFFEGFLKARGDSAVANLTDAMDQATITQGGGGGGGGNLHMYLKQLRF